MWILFTAIYGFLIGFFTVLRKKASEKTHILFVLAFSSTAGFILVSWCAGEAFALGYTNILLILAKSFLVSLIWIFELVALKNYYISSLQPISVIKVILGFFLGLLIFHEPIIWWRFIGVAIILVGLLLLNQFDKKTHKNQILQRNRTLIQNSASLSKIQIKFKMLQVGDLSQQKDVEFVNSFYPIIDSRLNRNRVKAIIFFIISCCLSETSAILDKLIIDQVSTNQMQFWFMLFISILIWIYFLILCLKQRKILINKSDFKNWAMFLVPFIHIMADRFLFSALAQPDVLVSGVSIIKQLSTVVAVVFGGLLYKEPKLLTKLIFLAIILVGIVIVLI